MPKRVSSRDFTAIAEQISDDHKSRKTARSDLEKQWADIDRQVEMRPDTAYKLAADGKPDPYRKWMPEAELPLQAQTLEVLCADSRRMIIPDKGAWFSSHTEMTDEYLERADFAALITGDENEVPSVINQDNADQLATGALQFWHRQYDFPGHLDRINAEAFKYGTGVGRARLVTKSAYRHEAKGTLKDTQKFPVLVPRSIKNTYLDDSPHNLMNEGVVYGSSVIFEKTQHIDDLKAAAKGEDWMPGALRGLEGDKNHLVKLLEMEGDLLVSRSRDSLQLPNVVVTVVQGSQGGKGVSKVVRVRFNKYPFSSYLTFPYHNESLSSAYATSPLMKGRPIQIAAVDALNRLIMSGALKTMPPIKYDSDDFTFAANGGPAIFPGAQWPTTGKVESFDFGDPVALFNVYAGLLQQYSDVTGVNQPRLGAQTVSHTTAYAKEAELSRGTIRTVDYVKSILSGPLAQWLNMAYTMGRDEVKRQAVYIEPYGGFVDISKEVLPERVTFEAFGSGGPVEEQQKIQNRIQSLQMVLQIDQLRAQYQQLGVPPSINFLAAEQQVLRDGGWTDVDAITNNEVSDTGTQVGSPVGGTPQGAGVAPGAAIQALALAGQQ